MRIALDILIILLIILLPACGGGSGGSNSEIGAESADFGCDGGCANQQLTTADVSKILQQGVSSANILGSAATFAVSDRVGNILAVYQMNSAPALTTINGQIGASGGLEGIAVPATLAAISKAGTGAYLSSQGNAFSTRTASQIIQEHFNPGEIGQPAGPLFGVQFSQLLCGDVTTFNPAISNGATANGKFAASGLVGPRAMPLGLSADPGGLPLYKNGDVVGGIGVEFDGVYGLDRNIFDTDDAPEERMAMMAAHGFEIPAGIVGNLISAGGKTLRTLDLSYSELDALPDTLPDLNSHGRIVAVPLFSSAEIRAGATFGEASSGVLRTSRAGVPAAILVNSAGTPRFPSISGNSLPGGAELKNNEVEAVLDSAISVANRTRAAIRRPLDTPARVSIWVVDHLGKPLGMVRSEDAPVFGLDVALQKARSAAFFSSADTASVLSTLTGTFTLDYRSLSEALFGTAVFTRGHAFSTRAIGNLTRPFFLDGLNGHINGPLSLPFPGTPGSGASWSPFNTGLQLDLIFSRLVQPVLNSSSVPSSCTESFLGDRLRNGAQIFAGAVPLYRNGTLIGAIGISGDGTSQDDLIAFYSVSRPGLDAVGHNSVGDPTLGFNAPYTIRSDLLTSSNENERLRYVNCPEAPFRGENIQGACDGL